MKNLFVKGTSYKEESIRNYILEVVTSDETEELGGDKGLKPDNPEMAAKIISFFMANPYPNDEQVHEFAKNKNLDAHSLERYIYTILSTFLAFGKSVEKGITNQNMPIKELEMAMEVEKEHLNAGSTDPVVKKIVEILSQKIGRDHVAESKKYYEFLKEMEKKMNQAKD